MIFRWVQEQKRYKLNEICEILGVPDDKKAIPLINRLKSYGILKMVKREKSKQDLSELAEEDIEIADVTAGDDKYYYVFKYVGVITVERRVLVCYPKYFSKEPSEEDMCQIIKVLERYNKSKKQIIGMFNESNGDRSFNIIAVLMYLMQDYFDNGIYTNTKDIYEVNGPGEIAWDKTINETFALISNNRPYYVSLITRKRINDEYDYFQRLHRCILTKASRDFKQAKLLNLFGLSELELSDEVIEDFGDTNYILYRIENELNTVFITRKQLVLKTLYSYISEGGSLNDIDSVSLFGTSNFNLVWEDVCKSFFESQLKENLYTLFANLQIEPDCDFFAKQGVSIDFDNADSDSSGKEKEVTIGNTTLQDLIEKPVWTITGMEAAKTFEPDCISITNKEGCKKFVIIDAKYYNAILEPDKQAKNQPGIEDISKQYLYQLAYKDFIKAHEFNACNCFVLPTEEDHVVDKKEVYLNMFREMKLSDIKVLLLPAKIAYKNYLSDGHMGIDYLLSQECLSVDSL